MFNTVSWIVAALAVLFAVAVGIGVIPPPG